MEQYLSIFQKNGNGYLIVGKFDFVWKLKKRVSQVFNQLYSFPAVQYVTMSTMRFSC